MDTANFSGTEPLTDPGRIDVDRLADYLRQRIEGCCGPMRIEQFRGGQSNPTFLLRFGSGRRLVLRKKPDGNLLPSAHAVDREFRVISALAGAGFPVAAPRLLCTDDTLVGAMFYVMDHVEGRIFWDPALPGLPPAERGAIYAEIRRVAARLHGFDPNRLGLADFGRPDAYLARQIRRWTAQYAASQTEPIAAMDMLMAWLPDHMPPDRPGRLIHGDLRIDNMIIHPSEPRVLAVLDWELSTLGDPVADFAYHTLGWHLAPKPYRGLAGLDLAALGIPAEPDYRARYFTLVGEPAPSDSDWNGYLAFCLFRVAAIRQGIMRRVVDGTAVSAHARQAGALARPIAELALRFARRTGTLQKG